MRRSLAAALVMLCAHSALAQHLREAEPNDTAADATPLLANPVKVKGNISPGGDADVYSFQAAAGSRVYAATMTAFSSTGSTDTVLELLGSDGVTILESDDNNAVFGPSGSSIAGAAIPADGTYYLRVRGILASTQIRGYDLYVRIQPDAPTPEAEPNDAPASAQPVPPGGHISGQISSFSDVDVYSFNLGAGDTAVVSLDLDPERDNVEWDGILQLGPFGGLFMPVNDAGSAGPDSESHHITAKDAGTYYAVVSANTEGTTFGTYALSISIIRAEPCPGNSSVHHSPNVPVAIPTGPANVSSSLIVPGHPRIGRLRVGINLTHSRIADLDVELRAPGGNVAALFTDINGLSVPLTMDVVLDDGAAIPINSYNVFSGMNSQPMNPYRLDHFYGQDAGGQWTLTIRDDAADNGGVLNSWFLEICEEPLSPCPSQIVVYSSDFEPGDGGFTSAGVENEWQWGVPNAEPITTAHSGVKAWVTDLTGPYNASSNQDLISPAIDLTAALPPIYLRWAQKHQIESASFDRAWVQVQNPGGGNPTRVWEWLGASMRVSVGNPGVILEQSAGWAMREADISAYAGQVIEVRFHLDSDPTVQLAGLAIDDVSVRICGGTCRADWDNNARLNSNDISAFLTSWLDSIQNSNLVADFDQSGQVNSNDISAFLTAWLDAIQNGC